MQGGRNFCPFLKRFLTQAGCALAVSSPLVPCNHVLVVLSPSHDQRLDRNFSLSSRFGAMDTSGAREIDPVTILTLVAANGYAADLLPCASLTRDPDWWSYLVRVPRGDSGLTLLHAAAFRGDFERARALLDLGALPNALALENHHTTGQCATPLHACINGFMNCNTFGSSSPHLATARTLLERGADIDARDAYRRDPLFQLSALIFSGRLLTFVSEFISLLLDWGADPNTNNGHVTLLQCCAARAPFDLLTLLVSRGANVNARPLTGYFSALLRAASRFYSHPDVGIQACRFLLENGADAGELQRYAAQKAAEPALHLSDTFFRLRPLPASLLLQFVAEFTVVDGANS